VKMQRIVLLVLIVVAACYAEEVQSTTTFKPEGCESGRLSKAGDSLSMHYTGTIDKSSKAGEGGKKFDSSLDRGDPFTFTLGTGQVIKGWDEGLLGMCVGEKRTLVIPPALGYGESGAGGDIPGGATLNFEVECLGIDDAAPEPNIFADIDANKDSKLTKEEVAGWFKKEQGAESIPEGLWEEEDADKDGFITWAEFNGPKGSEPPINDDAKDL